ncbi:NAD(P)/FAD-dependent oxidoreductase [Pokkaliibacter sp. CJK22405]|uniref:NAD(P)/FAD-dependent oxidoreductase n=1 Tax=Pokkaliibacter sp. CJK22405 TaxID=3384615 RepID=UPI003984AFF1
MASKPQTIAVIGSGISGLSCAWLLSKNHKVILFEKDDRFGGHSNTVDVNLPGQAPVPVDTGFIVFNHRCYPQLVRMFDHLGVKTSPSDMSFAVSLDQGAVEYSGTSLAGLFAQRRNLVAPSFWGMLADIMRFYRQSDDWRKTLSPDVTLGQLLAQHKFGERFRDEHLLPMGAAIWSTPMDKMLDYPALTFLRFCENHGLLQISDRPQWYTVDGGSRNYVEKLLADLGPEARCNRGVRSIRRLPGKVQIEDWQGDSWRVDQVVLACHADQSLGLLADATADEQRLLSAFPYQRNRAILHSDTRLMPVRRRAWASWNYLGQRAGNGFGQHAENEFGQRATAAVSAEEAGTSNVAVSYWMNQLQNLNTDTPMIVTLNPPVEPDVDKVHASFLYDHPAFSAESIRAQPELWAMQGQRNTWYCGAWFGYGFHEDGLQSGLAVAEALGGVQRPWAFDQASEDRVNLPLDWAKSPERAA